MDTEKPRKPRSDKGNIMATSRDLKVLPWISHQYAARLDQVRDLLSRYPGKETKVPGVLGMETVKDQIDRWRQAGWVEYKRFLADEPGWVWVTRKGLHFYGLDELYTAAPPAATRLAHIYAVNEIRLILGKQYAWTSERAIKAGMEQAKKGQKLGPIPDATIAHPSGTVAIEVEISIKKPEDLLDKVKALVYATHTSKTTYTQVRTYAGIFFFVATPSIQRAVKNAASKLGQEDKERIQIILSDLSHG